MRRPLLVFEQALGQIAADAIIGACVGVHTIIFFPPAHTYLEVTRAFSFGKTRIADDSVLHISALCLRPKEPALGSEGVVGEFTHTLSVVSEIESVVR